MANVVIIDYGMGNLHSIAKAVEHAGDKVRVHITDQRQTILDADRVIFPGVGAIRDCMQELDSHRLLEVLGEVARSKPMLGVCLGMQALMDHSEENGGVDCLGLLPGRVRHFGDHPVDPDTNEPLKVPHMGWNRVHQLIPHPLWSGIGQDSWFYFVHSYFVEPANTGDTSGSTRYSREFASAVARDNLFAVQFHPEKSQKAGLTLLSNFLNWDGQA
jgi:glutamine amidotransferase